MTGLYISATMLVQSAGIMHKDTTGLYTHPRRVITSQNSTMTGYTEAWTILWSGVQANKYGDDKSA